MSDVMAIVSRVVLESFTLIMLLPEIRVLQLSDEMSLEWQVLVLIRISN